MKDLIALSERDLQEDVIVPLLRAVGYEDIRTASGTQEKGKDLIATKTDEFGQRTLHAIQIKKHRISASVGKPASLGRILDQLRQATRELVYDPSTNVKRRPDGCLYITPYPVAPYVFEAFEEQLKDARLENVRVLDGIAVLRALSEKAPEILKRLGAETKYRLDLATALNRVPEANAALGVPREIFHDSIYVPVAVATEIAVPVLEVAAVVVEIEMQALMEFIDDMCVVWSISPQMLAKQSIVRATASDDVSSGSVQIDARALLAPAVRDSARAIEECRRLASLNAAATKSIVKSTWDWLIEYAERIRNFLRLPSVAPVRRKLQASWTIREQRLEIRAENITSLGRDVLVLGPPGGGKTTLLRQLCRLAATDMNWLPVFVKLTDVRQPSARALKRAIREATTELSADVEQLLKDPTVRLFLDGLDETGSMAPAMARALERFKSRGECVAPLVVACRDTFGIARIGDALTVSVQTFDAHSLDAFIARWFRGDEQTISRLDRWLRRKSELKRVLAIPLMAALFCALAEASSDLPGTELELYQGRFDLLLGRWEVAKGTIPMRESIRRTYVHCLSWMAMRCHLDERRSEPRNELIEYANQHSWIGQVLVTTSIERGLLLSNLDDSLSLGHLTFQEYLAAVWLRDKNATRFLVWALRQKWWLNVLRYYAQMKLDLTDLVRELLTHRLEPSARTTLEALAALAPLTNRGLLTTLGQKKLGGNGPVFPWSAEPRTLLGTIAP